MGWFTRKSKNINTPTEQKKETPDGFWHKTPSGNIIDREDLEQNNWVSPEDEHHFRIGSKEYFQIIFDENKFTELDADMTAKDPLKFSDTKSYEKRLEQSKNKSNL